MLFTLCNSVSTLCNSVLVLLFYYTEEPSDSELGEAKSGEDTENHRGKEESGTIF
jgi:hypothetical protein